MYISSTWSSCWCTCTEGKSAARRKTSTVSWGPRAACKFEASWSWRGSERPRGYQEVQISVHGIHIPCTSYKSRRLFLQRFICRAYLWITLRLPGSIADEGPTVAAWTTAPPTPGIQRWPSIDRHIQRLRYATGDWSFAQPLPTTTPRSPTCPRQW